MANRATLIRQRRTLVCLALANRYLAGAIADALLHYHLGLKTAGVGLPTDWSHVAQRMAETLEGATETEQEVRRGGA